MTRIYYRDCLVRRLCAQKIGNEKREDHDLTSCIPMRGPCQFVIAVKKSLPHMIATFRTNVH
jgi:hypothetical protein